MRRFASLVMSCQLALAGCAGEADVYGVVQDKTYSPSVLRHAAANKPLRTVLAGNPFEARSAQAVHETVLSAMQPANWHQPLPLTPKFLFTNVPDGSHNARYHVVVALNPDESRSAWHDAPCAANTALPTTGPGDRYTVRMIFCRDEAPLSISQGTLTGPALPEDARFRRMIARATMALFPQRRDDRNCLGVRREGRC